MSTMIYSSDGDDDQMEIIVNMSIEIADERSTSTCEERSTTSTICSTLVLTRFPSLSFDLDSPMESFLTTTISSGRREGEKERQEEEERFHRSSKTNQEENVSQINAEDDN